MSVVERVNKATDREGPCADVDPAGHFMMGEVLADCEDIAAPTTLNYQSRDQPREMESGTRAMNTRTAMQSQLEKYLDVGRSFVAVCHLFTVAFDGSAIIGNGVEYFVV